MASQDNDWSNLVMVIDASNAIQELIAELLEYFEHQSMPKGKGFIVADCKPKALDILQSIKEVVKKDFASARTVQDIVKAIVPKPERAYFISPIQLHIYREGTMDLASMVGEPGACIILIPVAIVGSGDAKLNDPKTKETKTISFARNTEILVNGRCKIRLEKGDIVACAFVCIGRDKGIDKNKG